MKFYNIKLERERERRGEEEEERFVSVYFNIVALITTRSRFYKGSQ